MDDYYALPTFFFLIDSCRVVILRLGMSEFDSFGSQLWDFKQTVCTPIVVLSRNIQVSSGSEVRMRMADAGRDSVCASREGVAVLLSSLWPGRCCLPDDLLLLWR